MSTLPAEIVCEILRQVNNYLLIRRVCTLVCKKWNDIIYDITLDTDTMLAIFNRPPSKYEIGNIKQAGGARLMVHGGRLFTTIYHQNVGRDVPVYRLHKIMKINTKHSVNIHYKLSLYHSRMNVQYPLPYHIHAHDISIECCLIDIYTSQTVVYDSAGKLVNITHSLTVGGTFCLPITIQVLINGIYDTTLTVGADDVTRSAHSSNILLRTGEHSSTTGVLHMIAF